jgi:hypothetical protein
VFCVGYNPHLCFKNSNRKEFVFKRFKQKQFLIFRKEKKEKRKRENPPL